jgi:predicted ATPase/SAM-dependent methyltransferase
MKLSGLKAGNIMKKSKLFSENLANLGVKWDVAPQFSAIEAIEKRVIIGKNGCGKSRLLKALDMTLQENSVSIGDILYANFPEMSRIEFSRNKETNSEKDPNSPLYNLKKVAEGRVTGKLRDILEQIGGNPSVAITNLLSSDDDDCKKAADEFKAFVAVLLGNEFNLENTTRHLEADNDEGKPYSPGQRCLLYMSFVLGVLISHRPTHSLYILLDEPDQHLHPLVTNDFITQLNSKLPNSKLWIATHSVHIMAMDDFKFNEIIHVENNEIQSPNSKMYDDICETMVDTKGMRKFIELSGMYGFYGFFKECFEEPDSESEIDAESDSMAKIKQEIRGYNISKVLDYGAGKGRFYKLLADISNIDYYAYDHDNRNHNELKQLLDSNHIYSKDIPPVGKFDVILLINTLHEIPHCDWAAVLETIKNLLTESGYLFFCETVPLITGEFIENTGFLVLGVDEQKVLFGDRVSPLRLDDKTENGELLREGKLHFSKVLREEIPNLIDDDKMVSVLTALENNSYKKWLKLRDGKQCNARNTAFFAIQHLNAKTALTWRSLKFGKEEWFILKDEGEHLLLVSKYILEVYRFPPTTKEEKKSVELANMADSELRKTLNNDKRAGEDGDGDFFFDRCGFTDKERERIFIHPERKEKVFLLSLEEIELYFGDMKIAEKKIDDKESQNAYPWWVEVSSTNQEKVTYITETGVVETKDWWEITRDSKEKGTKICGLRPALWIKKSPSKKFTVPIQELPAEETNTADVV